ncbi:hypothetical protein SPRG_09763 [Saprolegnia parasitica CBS 223.65]|uniref:Uncharacterized protein n=1 Tax=Saprolegnia parasitica (strain CBS 223.65) TaxID=695850 RepID=A0A067C2M4_SAPPC|nr:hypothetical protein SPRG_09763 [Saprolegnia parasitica CBS 223.65]KDO25034.1 hypothetical protein SPRG_09763 [Saprolegnia parasitica CBS 223.65]|eukprot:XP_012204302.1 hypothetical protein SPRG_09763 [Saprolegnia parasitica CBS 223.65]
MASPLNLHDTTISAEAAATLAQEMATTMGSDASLTEALDTCMGFLDGGNMEPEALDEDPDEETPASDDHKRKRASNDDDSTPTKMHRQAQTTDVPVDESGAETKDEEASA